MKPGYCYIAERAEPSQAVRRIIESFKPVGAVLVNPHSRRITELADDGDQVDTTEAALLHAADTRKELSFQLWFSFDTDVSCGLRQVGPGVISHGYTLSGLDRSERQRLMRWAIDYFRVGARQGTALLLVVDPDGRTANIDWDAVAAGQLSLPPTLPATLGLPCAWAERDRLVHVVPKEEIGKFEVFKLSAGAPDDLDI